MAPSKKKPITLKDEDFDKFVEKCENPSPPNEKLKRDVPAIVHALADKG